MTVLALLHPTGLVGDELRRSLERRRDLWQELQLLSTSDEEVGALTEVGGAAALVQHLDHGSLAKVDVAFLCGPMAPNRPVVEALPAAATKVILSPDAGAGDGRPVVAGVNLETAEPGTALVSPHAGTIALAHLLHPLTAFEPHRAVATLLQPASVHGAGALDEVLDQTRAILRFDAERRHKVFPTQLAFNALSAEQPDTPLAEHLATLLGHDVELSTHFVQAAVFHGLAMSLYLELDADPGLAALRHALAAHPFNELAEHPERLGPVDSAAREEVLVGEVRPAPDHPGAYWIWAVIDNLTCGGATNAIHVLEALVGERH